MNINNQASNILIVSDDFVPAATGVGSHLQVVTQELLKKGYTVVVVTSRRKGQPELENWCGVKVYRLFSIPIAGFYQVISTPAQIKKIVIENQIDLIHHHYLSLLLKTVFNVGRKLKIPQIYTYHMSDALLSQPFFMRPFRRLIHRLSIYQYNLFDRIISPSGNIAREIKQKGVTTQIEVIANPVAMTDRVRLIPIVGSEKFQIFFAGRLAPEKNIPLLLKAFSVLYNRNKNIQLQIAGEGGERGHLMQLSKDLGIEHNVRFLGHLNHTELVRCYSTCDVFVLPSILEVQAIVVIEAMRFSKPVIVTQDIACATELVEDGKNGFIIDSKNELELADKLEQLADSPEMCERMGQLSLEKSDEFSPNSIIQEIRRVYGDVFTLNVGNAGTKNVPVPLSGDRLFEHNE